MVLYIDTTQPSHLMVGIVDAKGWLARRRWHETSFRAERLLPTIEKIISQRVTNRRGLQGIVVVKGPASFTAARSGVVVANALSAALGVPAVGVRRRVAQDSAEKLLADGLKLLTKTTSPKIIKPIYQAPVSITLSA